MKIILSCYTDLGNKNTPKGRELEKLAIKFHEKGLLKYVICRGIGKEKINLDKKYIKKPLLIGNKIPLLLSAIKKYLFKSFDARQYSQDLFDVFSKKYIKNADVLCCLLPTLPESLKIAKKRGINTIQVATSNPYEFVIKIMNEEFKKFNIPLIKKNKFYKKNMLSYKLADKIIAKSNFTIQTLKKSGISENKISKEIIYSQVKLNKFALKKSFKHKFRVIFIGQVGFNKGCYYLLEAWKKLNFKDAELIVIGKIEPTFQKVIEQYKTIKSIKILGYVKFEELKKNISQSSVFCLPSLSEGSPQAAAEAMAVGLPIIVTPNTGSFIENNVEGFIVPVKNIDKLAEKIAYLKEHPNKLKEMGLKGREKVIKYCSDDVFFNRFQKIILDESEDLKKAVF